MAGGFMDKVKDFVKGNPEQAASALEKVEDVVDQRSGGKYSEQVASGQITSKEAAKEIQSQAESIGFGW